MPVCAACARELEARFRFCPWCGVARAAVSLDEAEATRLAEFLEQTTETPTRPACSETTAT
jgi:hypothetical protein